MRIDNRFTVGLPVEDAWRVLLDVERIAPCMPGVELEEVTEDELRGVVNVRLGAITAQYRGAVLFAEVHEASRRIVLSAEGRDTSGQGNASAEVTATLHPAGEGRTEVAIETDLTISGTIAQCGRGVLADVSAKLLADFARCVESEPPASGSAPGSGTDLTTSPIVGDEVADGPDLDLEHMASPEDAAGPAEPGTAPSVFQTVQSRPAEPVDLLAVAGSTVAQRAIPAAIVGVFLLQGVVNGRLKRLGLAVVGSALVAALVSGRQHETHRFS